MVVAFAFASGLFESVRGGLVGAGSGRRIVSRAGVATVVRLRGCEVVRLIVGSVVGGSSFVFSFRFLGTWWLLSV